MGLREAVGRGSVGGALAFLCPCAGITHWKCRAGLVTSILVALCLKLASVLPAPGRWTPARAWALTIRTPLNAVARLVVYQCYGCCHAS